MFKKYTGWQKAVVSKVLNFMQIKQIYCSKYILISGLWILIHVLFIFLWIFMPQQLAAPQSINKEGTTNYKTTAKQKTQ